MGPLFQLLGCGIPVVKDSVQEAPALQKPLMIPAELRLGERADIICTLRRGDLPVTFKWFFNGREIRGEELGKVTSYDVRSSVYLMDKLRARRGNPHRPPTPGAPGFGQPL
ncbi:ig-like domain-containing protein [Trichonephila inaurata madagascariensis]|uniref:Ig-like domain-containing protein n=1 Tax=Trichonephila inaurata madagascariensis TaxID=2747483 RepID=A0A8X6YR43_9ARAC|nr:ig-like domain-containing protein [Trichonephila inaurata madagascariensis]